MKRFKVKNINTPEYWNQHQTARDFGLRQQKYDELAGTGLTLIELGCGLSPFLAVSSYAEKWGIDFSPETIIEARKLYPDINYCCGTVYSTPFRDKYFGISVAGEVIEHLENPKELIAEMARISHKIIISSPILEIDEPEHLWEFSEEDLTRMLKPYGKVTCETIESERFPGRKYIFATCETNS